MYSVLLYVYALEQQNCKCLPELDTFDATTDPVHGITELRWHVVTVVTADVPDGIIGLMLHEITADDVTGIVTADDIAKRRLY